MNGRVDRRQLSSKIANEVATRRSRERTRVRLPDHHPMTLKRRFRPLSGVRGRVFLTVLVATARLYSLLGSFGFLYSANNGRDAIQHGIEGVVDQLEAAVRQLAFSVQRLWIGVPLGVLLTVAMGPRRTMSSCRSTTTVPGSPKPIEQRHWVASADWTRHDRPSPADPDSVWQLLPLLRTRTAAISASERLISAARGSSCSFRSRRQWPARSRLKGCPMGPRVACPAAPFWQIPPNRARPYRHPSHVSPPTPIRTRAIV